MKAIFTAYSVRVVENDDSIYLELFISTYSKQFLSSSSCYCIEQKNLIESSIMSLDNLKSIKYWNKKVNRLGHGSFMYWADPSER